MYKRFRTVNGKKVRVQMTDKDFHEWLMMKAAYILAGFILTVLLWGAM